MPFQRAKRLEQLPPYLFIEIDRKKRAAIAAGKDVIDFGVGDPDRPTPKFIIDRAAQTIYDPKNHRYPYDAGYPEFKQAAGDWFAGRFGVRLDPAAQILTLIGSKEGLGHLPLAVINPGDVGLVPTPGYPVYQAATLFAGGIVHHMLLTEQREFLPDLDAIPADVLSRTRLMFLNYPNNPTGAVASLSFYEKAVSLAKKHGFIICSDAPYSETFFDAGDKPPSILQVPGSIDCCIEMHSLSKTFNMTGWRIAFAVGNADVLAALAKVKGNMDSGAFGAIQQAGALALQNIDGPQVQEIRETYRRRRDALVPVLDRAGFKVFHPRATFFVWSRCPTGYSSMDCSAKLLDESAIVAIPGIGFGPQGEGYVRFALTVEVDRIQQAGERLAKLKW
ncbi:MAG TPA: LL-diaminopimelate aminotransferase [Phycisphaerae bacterium]|nr:LL-diaminopimelate aminotransferase [Phycisphaerae bacterium]